MLIEPYCFCGTNDLADLAFTFNIIGAVFSVDDRFVWHRLRKWNVDCRALAHPLFKFIWDLSSGEHCCA